MAKVFNGTAHPINIITNGVFNPEIRKYVIPDGELPNITMVIQKNEMLSAKIETMEIPVNDINGIPVFTKIPEGECDMPPVDEYDVIICSQLYISAVKVFYNKTSLASLYTICDPVYSHDGKTVLGCRGICKAF